MRAELGWTGLHNTALGCTGLQEIGLKYEQTGLDWPTQDWVETTSDWTGLLNIRLGRHRDGLD